MVVRTWELDGVFPVRMVAKKGVDPTPKAGN